MRAKGYWTWWNQYGNESVETCVQRVKAAGLAGVIVKYSYPVVADKFAGAGIPWATERYTYPDQPRREAEYLASDIVRGAQFAVINAEKEWENLPAAPMERLIARFRELQPHAELYASVDTRGNRTNLPYQRVLGEHIAGWMPMIYPLAFYPHRPEGYVASAFRDCLEGKSFQGKPVLPTIQTYGNIGAGVVKQEMAEVVQRGLLGYQAYTVGHATGAEWQAFSDWVPAEDEEDEMTPEQEELLRAADNRSKWNLGVSKIHHEQIKVLQQGLMRTAVMVVEHLDAHGDGVSVEVIKMQTELVQLGEALVQLDDLPKDVDALEAKLKAIAAAAGAES